MNIQSKVIANILNLKSQNATSNISTKCIKQISKNVFGVFVTIRRSQKLPSYPVDIHGCIGYWSPDYKVLSPPEIISHLMDVSLSAMNNDSRRDYFQPIETDLGAIVEIDFMLQPLIPINSETGILENGQQFKNSKYGLIVEGYNGSRATYLPHVFPDSTLWAKLKESLISKAGVGENGMSNNKFYAYTIVQLKSKIFEKKNGRKNGQKSGRKTKKNRQTNGQTIVRKS